MKKFSKKYQVGIIGSAGDDDYNGNQGATARMMKEAEMIGQLLAKNKVIVVTGGKSGIMEAGARGAKKVGGQTVGVVEGVKRFTSNDFTDIEVVSGMKGDGMDELLLVNMCDALIVIGGGAGTLQEITIAYRNKKPVVALTTQSGWAKKLAGKFLDSREKIKIEMADNAKSAVEKVLKILNKN